MVSACTRGTGMDSHKFTYELVGYLAESRHGFSGRRKTNVKTLHRPRNKITPALNMKRNFRRNALQFPFFRLSLLTLIFIQARLRNHKNSVLQITIIELKINAFFVWLQQKQLFLLFYSSERIDSILVSGMASFFLYLYFRIMNLFYVFAIVGLQSAIV